MKKKKTREIAFAGCDIVLNVMFNIADRTKEEREEGRDDRVRCKLSGSLDRWEEEPVCKIIQGTNISM